MTECSCDNGLVWHEEKWWRCGACPAGEKYATIETTFGRGRRAKKRVVSMAVYPPSDPNWRAVVPKDVKISARDLAAGEKDFQGES